MIKNNGQMNAGQLSDNPYAWNEKAHLIFVDQPRHVGFSTVNEPSSGKCTSSIEAADDIVIFYQEWLNEYKGTYANIADRKLYIAGESKAGCGARFRQKLALVDAICSHACSLEANMRVINDIPLGCPLPLIIATVNSV
jgi:carboxypeptidase C (cathepsin A)